MKSHLHSLVLFFLVFGAFALAPQELVGEADILLRACLRIPWDYLQGLRALLPLVTGPVALSVLKENGNSARAMRNVGLQLVVDNDEPVPSQEIRPKRGGKQQPPKEYHTWVFGAERGGGRVQESV
jgi:hypothetical protein